MAAILQRITAIIMTILAFFGLGPKNSDVKPEEPAAPDWSEGYTVRENEVTFSFISNPSTGYSWETAIDGESVVLTDEQYTNTATPGVAGAPGTQTYTFTAVKAGKTTLTFTYRRPWESDDPAYINQAVISVTPDMQITVESFCAL